MEDVQQLLWRKEKKSFATSPDPVLPSSLVLCSLESYSSLLGTTAEMVSLLRGEGEWGKEAMNGKEGKMNTIFMPKMKS